MSIRLVRHVGGIVGASQEMHKYPPLLVHSRLSVHEPHICVQQLDAFISVEVTPTVEVSRHALLYTPPCTGPVALVG